MVECQQLKLNVSKTKYMIFNNGKNSDLTNVCVVMDGNEIERVREIKYLGVILDDRLKMKSHVDYISKKAAKKIGFLARINKKLPIQQRILIYKSIIAPHFEYCATILFTCGENEISRLQKLQNRAMRIIIRCSKATSIALMLETLCWMTVKQRIVYRTMVYVFRLKNKLHPACMTDAVEYVGDNNEHNVRNANDFRIQMMHKKSTRKMVFHSGLQMFNNLPEVIKSETNFTTFKRLLIPHIKETIKLKS